MVMSNRTRETIQLIGAIAGILAFVGMLVLWISVGSALESVAEQHNEVIFATKDSQEPSAMYIDFSPFSAISEIWSSTTLVVLLGGAVIVLLFRNRKLRRP